MQPFRSRISGNGGLVMTWFSNDNIPIANICTDLLTYTYPGPKGDVDAAFVVTQVFIFETTEWISVEFSTEDSKFVGKGLDGVHSLFELCPSSRV
jgi:hypothetical protein